jgi:hypothetical protein
MAQTVFLLGAGASIADVAARPNKSRHVGCQNSIGLWNVAVFRSPAVDRCLLCWGPVDRIANGSISASRY